MTWRRAWVLGLLLLQFGLLVAAMPHLALTYDEPSHLTSGYTALARGMDGLWTMQYRGHPVLFDAWAALPLYLNSPDIPLEQLTGWRTDYKSYVAAFIREIGPLDTVEIAGRVPTALITILLSATVYRWTQDLTHRRAGWLSLAILVFDPNLLAHGRLATNDLGVTALGTLGLFLCWRWRKHPRPQIAAAAGVVLGLTCLAKSSGLLWLPAGVLYILLTGNSPEISIRRRSVASLILSTCAGATIWAAYGFSVGAISDLPGVPVPAAQHWNTLFFQATSANQRLAYALGKLKMGGWWWYFPVAFALKTPIPLMLALTGSLGYVLSRKKTRQTLILPLVSAAFYLLVAILQGPNIGYRHLLPVHPAAYLVLALAFDASRDLRRRLAQKPKAAIIANGLMGTLCIWYVGSALANTPNEIAYFNELVGSQKSKHQYLISSNLDWGQMTKELSDYLETHAEEDTYLAYTHIAPYPLPNDAVLPPHPDGDPDYAPFHPAPGLYLIGATSLHIPAPCCDQGLDSYAFFRNTEPVETIGDAILVYRTTEREMPTWLVQCTVGHPLLNSQAVSQGLDQAETLRQVTLDCSQAWLYPEGGQSPGIYAVADPTPNETATIDRFIQHQLASTRRSYSQPAGFILEPFSLYEPTAAIPLPQDYSAGAGQAGSRPSAVQVTPEARYTLDRRIEFLGVSQLPNSENREQVEAVTWWRIIEVPEELFSIMAHLVTPQGDLIAIGDAMTVDRGALKPGDIVAQRHTFALDEDGTDLTLWLRTGVYWLGSLDRWTIEACPDCDAIFAPLQ